MSKRSSPDGSDDGDSQSSAGDDVRFEKRRRLVEFEPVRLVSVMGVNDIDARAAKFAAAKLTERILHKDRLIQEEKKKVDTLRARQDKDDNTLCTINRHWNRLEEDMRILLSRHVSGENEADEEGRENGDTSSRAFLEDVAQMEGEDCDLHYDKRVKNTLELINRFLDLDKARNEQFSQLNRKLQAFIDKEENTSYDVISSLTAENATLVEENRLLKKSANRLQNENRDLKLKAKKLEDEQVLLETKNEELTKALDEKDFDLGKAWRRVDKVEYRLNLKEKERVAATAAVAVCESAVKKENGSGACVQDDEMAGISNKKLDSLQQELEQQTELAERRLQEIQEYLEKNNKLVAQLSEATNRLNHLPSDVIEKSPEFITLQSYYSYFADMLGQYQVEMNVLRQQLDLVKANHMEQIEHMEAEQQMNQRRMQQTSAELESQCNDVRKQYEMLRIEFEQHLANNENQGSKQQDVKTLLNSLKTQNYTLKVNTEKFKKKWGEAVTMHAKVQKELENERRQRERCVCVEVDDATATAGAEDPGLASPDHVFLPSLGAWDEPTQRECEEQPQAVITRLKQRVEEQKAKLDAFASMDAETRDKAEVMSRELIVRRENERLQAAIKKLAAVDRRERHKFWSQEWHSKVASLQEQVGSMEKKAAAALKEEQMMMAEMDSTGQAFEELQEQNGKLLQQLKEKDEQNMMMMSDRIKHSQMLNKIKEEKMVVEEQAVAQKLTIEALNHEAVAAKTALKTVNDSSNNKQKQITELMNREQQLRRSEGESRKKLTDVEVRLDKARTQLTEAQQAVISKTLQHEEDVFSIRRLKEEKSGLKKKLERAKKSEQLGSTDAVLMEEVRELKECLTCPSCKVRRKDGILTKCFHVFCMECLKSRYDTRRRKCPKCNAAFGANDFHRVYIG